MVGKFRKKPIVVEAILVSEAMKYAGTSWNRLPKWLAKAYDQGDAVFTGDSIHIHTLEGSLRAGPKDWLIQGAKGELYPCKPDIFEQTYEPVEEPNV